MRHAERVLGLLGGHFFWDEQRQRHRTSTLNDTVFNVMGDELRVLATVSLYRATVPKATVLVAGGRTPFHGEHPDAPHLSAILRRDLEELGVTSQDIEELDNDLDPNENLRAGTFSQLVHIARAVQRNPQIRELILITNEWHRTRVGAFLMYAHLYTGSNVAAKDIASLRGYTPWVQLSAAEDVLLNADPERWRRPVIDAYNTETMRQMVRNELRGANMVSDGDYTLPANLPARI